MKRPSSTTMALGHPIVTTPMALMTIGSIIWWLQDDRQWIAPLVLLLVMFRLMRRQEARTKYLAWKHEWDSFDEPAEEIAAAPKQAAGFKRPVLGGVLLATLAAYLATQLDDPVYQLALGWLAFGAVLTAIYVLVGKFTGRRAKRAKSPCVELAVTRPLFSVPTIRNAFRALPAHCREVLGQ